MTGHGTPADGTDAPVTSGELLHRNELMLCAGYVTGALLASSPAVRIVGGQVDPLDAEFEIPTIGRCRVRVTAVDDATDDRSCIDRIIETIEARFVKCDGCRGACSCVAKLRADVRRIAGLA